MSDEARELWEKICGIVRRFQEDKRFPRKWRVVINILLCALLVVSLYVMLGGPRFSVEGDFRAMERAHLVGPGRILGIEKVDFSYYDHLLIAEDEEGVILYAYDSQVWYRNEQLSYRAKTGDIMVLTGPAVVGSLNRHWDFELPIVVFGALAEAARARVEIAMPGEKTAMWWSVCKTMRDTCLARSPMKAMKMDRRKWICCSSWRISPAASPQAGI